MTVARVQLSIRAARGSGCRDRREHGPNDGCDAKGKAY